MPKEQQNIADFIKRLMVRRFESSSYSFYKTLTEITGQTPGWNFHKYLISKEGEVLSFDTKVEPNSKELTSQISKLL